MKKKPAKATAQPAKPARMSRAEREFWTERGVDPSQVEPGSSLYRVLET